MTTPRIALAAGVLVLAAAAAAGGEVLPPGSIRALPARAGSPSTLQVRASFDQPAGSQLQAYNVDIARGYTFDPRAVAGRCTIAEARSAKCPANSRIGGGTGKLSVSSATLPPSQFTIAITFYLTPAQRRGDIAGLVLAGREPKSGVKFALVGRLLRVNSRLYGLELRFANTAHELPTGLHVQLHKVRVKVGAERTIKRVSYHLLTNPRICAPRGWPFRLTISYSTGTEHYTTRAACSPR